MKQSHRWFRAFREGRRPGTLLALPILLSLLLSAGPATGLGTAQSQGHAQSGELNDGQYPMACGCTKTYRDGTEAFASSCDDYVDECMDIDTLVACQQDPSDPICDTGLSSCECYCEQTNAREFLHGPEDGVFLTGIPNLWQFDTRCFDPGVASTAPVGCGPVAIAMLAYWYDQLGYTGLAGAGAIFDPTLADWQGVTQDVADVTPNLCSRGGTATVPRAMAPSIEEYFALYSNGLDVRVTHRKVCDDCNTSDDDEMRRDEGLEFIQDELEAGRPVIIGFNISRAQSEIRSLGGDLGTYSGKLSNSTPGIGTITHYALITGYDRISGVDVISMNSGQTSPDMGGTTEDHPYEWNPAGKWVHLYAVAIEDPPDGAPWCPMDSLLATGHLQDEFVPTVDEDFLTNLALSHVGRSAPGASRELELLAGGSCGIARGGEWVTPYQRESFTCAGPEDLPTFGTDAPFDGGNGGSSWNPGDLDAGPRDREGPGTPGP